jgi:hypothetical protein
MQASSLRESDGGYIREGPFETLTRSNRQTLGPPRSFGKSGAVLRRKPQQPRFILLVALSADVAAEPGRITGYSYGDRRPHSSASFVRVADNPPAGPGKHYGFTREQ